MSRTGSHLLGVLTVTEVLIIAILKKAYRYNENLSGGSGNCTRFTKMKAFAVYPFLGGIASARYLPTLKSGEQIAREKDTVLPKSRASRQR